MNTETEIDRMKRDTDRGLSRTAWASSSCKGVPMPYGTGRLTGRKRHRLSRGTQRKISGMILAKARAETSSHLPGSSSGRTTSFTQVKYVAEMSGMPLPEHEPRQNPGVRQAGGQSFEDVEILPLRTGLCSIICKERGIPSAIAVANCKEMRYTTRQAVFFPLLSATEAARI